MPKLVLMPKIGVNMTEAVVAQWMVRPGDTVAEGDTLLLAETDKAVQEIPATQAGKVARLLVAEMETALCQQPILILLDPGEAEDEAAVEGLAAQALANSAAPGGAGEEAPAATVPAAIAPDSASGGETVKISPLAKKAAGQMGIDYRLVPPAKPGARITEKDVLAYAEKQRATPGPAAGGIPALEGPRAVIARRMTESVLTKPSVSMTVRVDARGLLEWREAARQNGEPPSFNGMLAAVTARALREHPVMNAALADDGIVHNEAINIGVAVDLESGLLVPVVRDADKKSAGEISAEISRLAQQARENRLGPDSLTGGTFTITNLGMFGIEQFDAIINPPECAILAVGALQEEPVVQNGAVVPGRCLRLTLSFDHRVVDGAPAARFLQRIKQLAESPIGLFC